MHNPALPPRAFSPYGHSTLRKSQLGFNGEFQQALTGLYLLGNGYRAYSPRLMRFHSPDALSPFDEGGINPYAYCQGDPVNLTDASGRWPLFFTKIKSRFRSYQDSSTASLELAGKSLFPRRSISEPNFTDGRLLINEYKKKLSSSTPFIDKLAAVNKNLASHGDSSLSLKHAEAYVDIADLNRNDVYSNATAHWEASKKWMGVEGPPGVVGAVFNLGGVLGAGVEDHALLKTGRSLQRTQRRVRDGIENAQTKKSPPV